jgi:hypothetical protein
MTFRITNTVANLSEKIQENYESNANSKIIPELIKIRFGKNVERLSGSFYWEA